MKLIKKLLNNIKQPKWRYGKRNTLLISIFLIGCVLLCFSIDSLENSHGLRFDFSFNQYATPSKESKDALKQLDSPVTMYLLYNSPSMDTQLLEILNRYPLLNKNITVSPVDLISNPAILSQFPGDITQSLTPDSVVIYSKKTDRYRLLTYENFLGQGFNAETGQFTLETLAYEHNITEAILYVSQNEIPNIGILTGHGELLIDEMAAFLEFLTANHYDYSSVQLQTNPDLSNIDLLMIVSPQKDFTPHEMELLDAFAKSGGSFIFIRNFTDPIEQLPNYHALLRAYGIVPKEGIVVASTKDEGSYFSQVVSLLPYMLEMDITLPLILSKMDVLMLPGASAFEEPPSPNATLSAGAVLQSGPNAYIRSVKDEELNIDQQPNDPIGTWPLAIYAQKMFTDTAISHAFAIGNSAIFMDSYLYERTFNAEFIARLLSTLLPQKQISVDVVNTDAFRPALIVGSQQVGLFVVIALPLSIVIFAIFFLIRRKNR